MPRKAGARPAAHPAATPTPKPGRPWRRRRPGRPGQVATLKSERVEGRGAEPPRGRPAVEPRGKPLRAPAHWRWSKGRKVLEREITLRDPAVAYSLAAAVCGVAATFGRRVHLDVEGATVRLVVGDEARGVTADDVGLAGASNVFIDVALGRSRLLGERPR